MDNKLTDKEIIKSLENCVNGFDEMGNHSCDTCPYTEIELCGKAQMTDCLDLIHRQKVEIEQFKDKVTELEKKLKE